MSSIIVVDPPYMPEVSSATDTSNFDVDIEASKANVSNGLNLRYCMEIVMRLFLMHQTAKLYSSRKTLKMLGLQ